METIITTVLATLIASVVVGALANEYRQVLKWRRQQLLSIRNKQADLEFKLNTIDRNLDTVLKKVNDRAYI